MQPLNEEILETACHWLAEQDTDLARIFKAHGTPPLWARKPTFATLIHIILEQQVSLASAQAAFDRLGQTIQPITPQAFLTLDDATLRQIGFSRQKTRYGRELATAVLHHLDLSILHQLSDDEVRAQLIQVKGIGNWTANIYLLMCLRRPDVWPMGDLAIVKAVQALKQLDHKPTRNELEAIAQPWRPWRSVATRLLWHYYLNGM